MALETLPKPRQPLILRPKTPFQNKFLFMDPAKKRFWGFGVATMILATLAALWFASLPSCRFRRNQQVYFQSVARGCDSLLDRYSSQTNFPVYVQRPFDGVPRVLLDLEPASIVIVPDEVAIVVGSPRTGGFGVVWQRTNAVSHGGRLLQVEGGRRHLLYPKGP
jgi:hypothetical protein